MRTTPVAIGLGLVLAGGCSSEAKPAGRFPPRPEGCDVKVVSDAPSFPTYNIGTVDAVCGEDIRDEECVRTLKDQVCKLGGDVVWGVADKPSSSVGKKVLSGRAAHTRVPANGADGGK